MITHGGGKHVMVFEERGWLGERHPGALPRTLDAGVERLLILRHGGQVAPKRALMKRSSL